MGWPSGERPWIELAPGQSQRFDLTLELSPGSYSVLMGYSRGVHSGPAIVSNQIELDIERDR